MSWPIEEMDKSPVQICIDLIYALNGCRLIEHEVKFGLPEELDQRPDIDIDANTFIPVIPLIEDTRFIGNEGVLYRRFHFNEFNIDQLWGDFSFPATTHQLLPAINTYTGLNITEDDVIDRLYYGKPTKITLEAHEHSLVWHGKHDVPVNYGLLNTTDLSGFKKFVST